MRAFDLLEQTTANRNVQFIGIAAARDLLRLERIEVAMTRISESET
jgi:hypothetical protein